MIATHTLQGIEAIPGEEKGDRGGKRGQSDLAWTQ